LRQKGKIDQILGIKYQDALLQAEKEAREKRVGVWKR
jgi:endonuclease YncB( thermonuclease family)